MIHASFAFSRLDDAGRSRDGEAPEGKQDLVWHQQQPGSSASFPRFLFPSVGSFPFLLLGFRFRLGAPYRNTSRVLGRRCYDLTSVSRFPF